MHEYRICSTHCWVGLVCVLHIKPFLFCLLVDIQEHSVFTLIPCPINREVHALWSSNPKLPRNTEKGKTNKTKNLEDKEKCTKQLVETGYHGRRDISKNEQRITY